MLKIGVADDLDRTFTQAVMLLANEPAYRGMRIIRLPEIFALLQAQKYLLAIENGELQGLIFWDNFEVSLAPQLIAERRQPTKHELSETGTSKMVTSIACKNAKTLKALWKYFVKLNKGHYIFYERHHKNNQQTDNIACRWIEPSGLLGKTPDQG